MGGTRVTLTRNDMTGAVAKFCLGLETHRRTSEGRVRSAKEFVSHFFPHDDKAAEDRIFHYLPKEVRGPILTAWGVRAQKSALKDADDKVRSVVHDALVAGDLDPPTFEDSLTAELVVRWVDLPDWWTFWRGGKIAKYSILKALESSYDLALFDAEWFLETVASKDGKLRGTDVLAEGLSKADLTEWLRAVYQGGDGSARGIVGALGWDQIVAKTVDDVLIAVLDAMATKVGLAQMTPHSPIVQPPPAAKEKPAEAKLPGVIIPPAAREPGEAKGLPSAIVSEPRKAANEELEGDAAANLFKDDEMIPISASQWDDEVSGEAAERGKSPSIKPPGSRKNPESPGKRSSKLPPARAKA